MLKIDKDRKSSLQTDILERGVSDLITASGLRDRLHSGIPLRVKYGIDPTMRSAHIGHATPIRKLRQFQELGHTAVLVIGDYTATIGDPSGRDTARKALTAEEVQGNAQEYFEQVYKILDRDKTEVHLQSEWYGKLEVRELIALMARTTYAQLMSHETFANRAQEGKPLGFHEMLYPVLQAYDSVVLKADVELGGADQRFNFVLTRDIQKAYGQRPEEVILTNYLPGTDGQEKMSKSLRNTIDLLDEAADMYGKVMSIPDDLMPVYFELATDFSMSEIDLLLAQLKSGDIHPMELKKMLATSITALYHDHEEVQRAQKAFKETVQDKMFPQDRPVIEVPANVVNLVDLLVANGLVSSKSEARRLISQKGIKVNNEPIVSGDVEIGDGIEVRVGKKQFVRFIRQNGN